LVGWLRRRPALMTWDDLVLVHAGLHPAWTRLDAVAKRIADTVDWEGDPMLNTDLHFATTVRYCGPDGALPPPEIAYPALRATRADQPGAIAPPFAPWDAFVREPRRIVFGHWAQRGLVHSAQLRGLDTGCVWGGRLTAWLADEDRLVSVPALRAYQAVP
jgi:bis(5'-nucleosyl)-tetraphosphatase (symmetrical)